MTVLHLAVKINNFEIVQILLKNTKINISIKDSQGKKPINYSKNTRIKQLLSHRFPIAISKTN